MAPCSSSPQRMQQKVLSRAIHILKVELLLVILLVSGVWWLVQTNYSCVRVRVLKNESLERLKCV